MASIGKLNLQLTANPSGFTTGIDKAGRAMSNFGSLAGGVLKSLASPTALFGGLTRFFQELVTEQFDIIDEISKQADVLDLTTEALTTYQHAAELSGVTNEELNKGLEFLTRNLGKAQILTETAGASLEQFGIDVDKLAEMSMEDRIAALADAYVALPAGIDRATFATAAFGKAGIRLSKFLEEGSEGLKKFKAEATLLGRTFSREQGAEVERAGDAIARISLAFDGLKRQLAIAIAPIVADITDNFMTWLPSVGGIPGIAQKIASTLLDIGEGLISVAETIVETLKNIEKARRFAFGSLGGLIKGAAGGFVPEEATEFGGARKVIAKARANLAAGPSTPREITPRVLPGIVRTLEMMAASGLIKEQVEEMQKAADVMERIERPVLPGAALAGTSEAVSAINRFNAQRRQEDQGRRLEELARLELAETRKVVDELKKVVRSLSEGDQL